MYPYLRRFSRQYVLPYWRWYLPATAAVLVTNWLAVQIPVALGAALDALKAGGQDGTVMLSAAKIAIFGVSIIVVRTISRIWFFSPARKAEFDLREDLFARMLRLQPELFARYTTGDLLSRTTSDVTFARAFAGFALLQGVNVIAALTMALGQMLSTSVSLTLAVAVPIFAGYGVVQAGTGRLFDLQRKGQQQVAEFADTLLGSIQGVATIQAFCVEQPFVERLDRSADTLRRTNLKLARLRAVVFPLLTVAGGLSVFLLLAIGGPLAINGTLSAGTLVSFVALVGYLLGPLRLLGVLLPVFQRAEASLERIYVLFDAPVDRPELLPTVAGSPAPRPFPSRDRGPTIELRDLTFAFPDAPDHPVLQHLDAVIPGGTSVGIFGRTGSGKTTLLRLLSRLRNPPAGTMLLDGHDIRSLDLDDLRDHLVVVPQTSFLFSETIRENVGLGLTSDTIHEAVRAAALSQDLAALPEGLDTVVGERGIVLSGGQRQRVALARGLARHGELILLDDVLSAVDHHTEQELIEMLEARRTGTGLPTRILVSHRMSALERCDQILVMDAGRIVDRGTHAELVDRPGLYQDAWRVQRQRPEDEVDGAPVAEVSP